MLDRIKTITRTRFRRTNFNSFLFFLIFAVVIWIVVQFSKEYDEIIYIPVEYVNVPQDKLITENNPDALKLRIEETGFRIAYKTLLPPTLYIDVSEAPQENGTFIYAIDEHREDIQAQTGVDFGKGQFLKDVILINYQQRKEKKLPVVSQLKVEFAAGYTSTGKLQLAPDSVTISGPDNILDTLNQLKTRPLTIQGVKNDLSGRVAVDTTHLSNVTLYLDQVEYSMDVEKFTEGSVEVPIELINVPQGLNVVIFPKEILLFYQANLKDFNEIDVSEFRVVCDFSTAGGENQEVLRPEIREQPSEVTNVRLNEKKVSYIIKR